MTLDDKLVQAVNNRDIDAYLNLLHADFTVTFHKSGNSFSKEEWTPLVTGIMANEKLTHESSRYVYENNDILIQHNFMSYPDDTKEAVMLIAVLKGGKIINLESGATPLD